MAALEGHSAVGQADSACSATSEDEVPESAWRDSGLASLEGNRVSIPTDAGLTPLGMTERLPSRVRRAGLGGLGGRCCLGWEILLTRGIVRSTVHSSRFGLSRWGVEASLYSSRKGS